MLDTKTRDEILLEEKIAQIDDINFDKIYDVEEFATKQIENLDEVNNDLLLNEQQTNENYEEKNCFEVEVEKNEFLDNFEWNKEEVEVKQKRSFKINNKLLFFTFTSIAALLSILLIYNVFVINSLSFNLRKAQNLKAQSSYTVSNVYENENNYIELENSSQIEIEDYSNNQNQTLNKGDNEFEQTSWFDYIVNQISTLFGG